jgi:BirA family biotin operon repressor/biotin-[acetyl-CoA-carboxylase] ligase
VGLWFSLWAPEEAAVSSGTLSAAVAVGAVRGIERAGAPPVTISWPNDLCFGSRKVGGILIERGRGGWAMGVGLNILGDPRQFVPPPDGDARAPVSLAQVMQAAPDRNELLAHVVEEITDTVHGLATGRRSAVVGVWRDRQRLGGRRVSLRLRNRMVVGRVRDLDPDRGVCLDGGPSWYVPDQVVRLQELGRMP